MSQEDLEIAKEALAEIFAEKGEQPATIVLSNLLQKFKRQHGEDFDVEGLLAALRRISYISRDLANRIQKKKAGRKE